MDRPQLSRDSTQSSSDSIASNTKSADQERSTMPNVPDNFWGFDPVSTSLSYTSSRSTRKHRLEVVDGSAVSQLVEDMRNPPHKRIAGGQSRPVIPAGDRSGANSPARDKRAATRQPVPHEEDFMFDPPPIRLVNRNPPGASTKDDARLNEQDKLASRSSDRAREGVKDGGLPVKTSWQGVVIAPMHGHVSDSGHRSNASR
jgi:hypothetical protein